MLIVAHQVVVLCLRTIIENFSESDILEIDAAGDVANCAITEYRFDGGAGLAGKLVLHRYNEAAPMVGEVAVTHRADAMVAARG